MNISQYLEFVNNRYHSGISREHSYRADLENLIRSLALGTRQPRIIVQVKHKPEAAISSDEIQKLAGTLKRNGDVGIFVTSGRFSKPSKKENVHSREHIELIDFDRIIELWQEYYLKMNDTQKAMLPLKPIYYLAPNL